MSMTNVIEWREARMKQNRIGLVGIGKLGTAMMKHWDQNNQAIGVYHPSQAKAAQFIQHYQNGYILTERELGELHVLILALPAKDVIPFIAKSLFANHHLDQTSIVNMATSLNSLEVKNKFPSLIIIGVKYMGHGRDLLEHGNGLFITESALPKHIEELFQYLGNVKVDSEDLLIQVNKLATYYAVKAAVEIENEFAKKEFPAEYLQRALTSIAPEVMRSYREGSLGHFAMEIVKELQLKRIDEDKE